MVSLVNNSFFRFLVAGAINTIATYAAFLFLNLYLHHAIAYTICYLVGVALSYVLAATYVFRTGIAVRTVLRYPSVYIIQYLYGLIGLTLLVDVFGIVQSVAVLLVIATSIPLTFIMTRRAMGGAPVQQSQHRASSI